MIKKPLKFNLRSLFVAIASYRMNLNKAKLDNEPPPHLVKAQVYLRYRSLLQLYTAVSAPIKQLELVVIPVL